MNTEEVKMYLDKFVLTRKPYHHFYKQGSMVIEANNFTINKMGMNKSIAKFGSIQYGNNVEEMEKWRVEVLYANGFATMVNMKQAMLLDKVRLAYYACELELPLVFNVWKWAVDGVLTLPKVGDTDYDQSYMDMRMWVGNPVSEFSVRKCLVCHGKEFVSIMKKINGKKEVVRNLCCCTQINTDHHMEMMNNSLVNNNNLVNNDGMIADELNKKRKAVTIFNNNNNDNKIPGKLSKNIVGNNNDGLKTVGVTKNVNSASDSAEKGEFSDMEDMAVV